LRARIEMLNFEDIWFHGGGARNLNRPFGPLALTILFSLMLAVNASAESVAETARKWGLIGPWSLDCSAAPDRNKGTVLAYEIVSGGRVVHRRDFGDTTEESLVVGAKVSGDGMLNLRVFFPTLKQTREYGLIMQPDGTMRAIYNRNQKGQYTIKDGKFTANGNPTPSQHKCSSQTSEHTLHALIVAERLFRILLEFHGNVPLGLDV
jgi:hypothetical protein